MHINTFLNKMDTCGDAYIYYISPVSKKVKYHIGTLEILHDCNYINQKYIAKKHSAVAEGQVKVFCWDLDDFKNIDVATVTKVTPLSEVINSRDE